MARYLDLPGGCAPPSTWRYVHPVPSLRVGRNPAVGGGEGPYTVFIYTYTCRAVSTWRWDISPGGGSQSTLLPPALALLARTSLSPIGAPRWGLTPAPGDLRSIPPAVTTWPTANWPTPRLAPSLMTAPGNAPRAMPPRELASFPGHHCPRPSSRSSAPALAPSPPISPGQLAHPRTPSIPSIPHRAPPRRRRREPPSYNPRPRLPALAFSTAAPVRPGPARMGWPPATVPVQQRRRRATTLRRAAP